ncbi:hypothetical protein [Flavobacterium sp.]|jgi:hypothetical protein|uniref:hypothetical protein n=1 Tax=Flavobacterium sp. TaxID=239 RepID=UPI0037C07A8B
MQKFKNFLLLVLISNFSFAQINQNDSLNSFKTDCEKIKINDSLIVKAGDYVLDKQKKINISKTLLDSTNIKSIYAIQNPCEKIHSGYRSAYIIERKEQFALLKLDDYVKNIQSKNTDYDKFQVIINGKLIDDYSEYLIEVTKKTKFIITKDELREKKITIRIEQN